MQQYKQEYVSGVSALSKGNYIEAILHFEKSISLAKATGLISTDDTFETAYFNLGQAKRESRKFTEAIADYQKALSLNPKLESAYLKLAECCFEIETYEAIEIAINTLKTCTRYFPQNKAAFMNLGIAYLKIGDKDGARTAFYSAKRLGNTDADRFIREWC